MTPPPPAIGSTASTAAGSPTAFASGHSPHDILGDGSEAALLGEGGLANGTNHLAAGSDDLLCPFGIANRKMRKRIDAEIEIRLVSVCPHMRWLCLIVNVLSPFL